MIQRLLPLGLLLATTVIMVFLIQDFVREVIIAPLLYAFWIATLIVRSLPQAVFWVLLVIVGLVLAFSSLSSGRSTQPGRRQGSSTAMGPVASWYRIINRGQKQDFARWRLARELSQLYWSILDQNTPYRNGFSKQSIEALDPNISPSIAAYLEAGHQPHQPGSGRWRSPLSKHQHSALAVDPEQVVRHLETLLEPNAGESIHDNAIE